MAASEAAYSAYIAVADVNGDGIPDVVSADVDASVSIYLGKHDGALQPSYSYKANAGPMWVGVGTYHGSERADAAVLNSAGNSIQGPTLSLLRNNGSGHFGSQDISVPNAAGFALADMNQDGNPDLIVTDYGNGSTVPSSVVILPGNGRGSFGKKIASVPVPSIFASNANPVIADFNGDGKPDFAVSTGSGVSVGLQVARLCCGACRGMTTQVFLQEGFI